MLRNLESPKLSKGVNMLRISLPAATKNNKGSTCSGIFRIFDLKGVSIRRNDMLFCYEKWRIFLPDLGVSLPRIIHMAFNCFSRVKNSKEQEKIFKLILREESRLKVDKPSFFQPWDLEMLIKSINLLNPSEDKNRISISELNENQLADVKSFFVNYFHYHEIQYAINSFQNKINEITRDNEMLEKGELEDIYLNYPGIELVEKYNKAPEKTHFQNSDIINIKNDLFENLVDKISIDEFEPVYPFRKSEIKEILKECNSEKLVPSFAEYYQNKLATHREIKFEHQQIVSFIKLFYGNNLINQHEALELFLFCNFKLFAQSTSENRINLFIEQSNSFIISDFVFDKIPTGLILLFGSTLVGLSQAILIGFVVHGVTKKIESSAKKEIKEELKQITFSQFRTTFLTQWDEYSKIINFKFKNSHI